VPHSGRVRISVWGGWVSESLRKDDEGVRGDRLSWDEDLGGSPWLASPRLAGEFKVFRKTYAFLEFAWAHREGRADAPAGGLRYDGTVFPAGRSVSAADRRYWFDLGFLAWGTVEEDYRIAFAAGARILSEQVVLSAEGLRTRETADSAFPFLEARGEAGLGGGLTFEGSARVSLFTISYREVVEREERIVQWVDEGGRVVGESLLSDSRRRLLKTQVNVLLECRAGVRLELEGGSAVFGGVGFCFQNCERVLADQREDLEWRAWTLEAGWELRF
jgi:hypothetical protein